MRDFLISIECGGKIYRISSVLSQKKPGLLFSLKLHKFQEKSAEVKPQKIGLKREKSFEDNRALLLIFHSLVFQLFFKEVAKKWCKGNVN